MGVIAKLHEVLDLQRQSNGHGNSLNNDNTNTSATTSTTINHHQDRNLKNPNLPLDSTVDPTTTTTTKKRKQEDDLTNDDDDDNDAVGNGNVWNVAVSMNPSLC